MSLLDRPSSTIQAIREILSSNPFYLAALQSGIANYTALARKIKPDVEQFIGTNVNIGTIVVAIKRLADALEKERVKRDNGLDKTEDANSISSDNKVDGIIGNISSRARLSLIGNIIDVVFKDEIEYEELSHVLDDVFGRETGYSLFQTNKQLRLFAEDIEEIRDVVYDVSNKYQGKIKKGLSKITITIPSSIETSDRYSQEEEGWQQQKQGRKGSFNVLSSILNIVYDYQLPLQDAFLTPSEIVLILNDKDAARAYETLREKMPNSQI